LKASWQEFAPRLSSTNCAEKSVETGSYNCLAFAAGDTMRWWEPYVIPPGTPGIYWPEGVHPDNTVEDWAAALGTEGFRDCSDGHLDPDLVKVAIFASGREATHAARQLESGVWVSKLGDQEDIEHERPDDVGGGAYGEVVRFLARARRPGDP
jgi:hypothetical protein